MKKALAIVALGIAIALGAPARATPPTGLVATVISSSEVQLTWDNGPNDVAYIVEKSTSPTAGFASMGQTAPGVETMTLRFLAPNTTYYFRVRAYPYTATVSAHTLP